MSEPDNQGKPNAKNIILWTSGLAALMFAAHAGLSAMTDVKPVEQAPEQIAAQRAIMEFAEKERQRLADQAKSFGNCVSQHKALSPCVP